MGCRKCTLYTNSQAALVKASHHSKRSNVAWRVRVRLQNHNYKPSYAYDRSKHRVAGIRGKK